MEETGYTGGDWSYLHTVQSNPVFMNSQVHQYLAIGVERTTDLTLDDGEHIQVAEVTIEELRTAYQSGLLRHPHTIAALTRVFDLWEKVPL
jgi:ADP-ribose pyrophosphatase